MPPPTPSPADDAPDAADVNAARSGDRAAFARLHGRYAPVVHAVLLSRVRREDADDLTQEVFLAAMRRLPELRDAHAFGGWLCAIARNAAASIARSRPVQSLPDALASRPATSANAALEAIRALPEAYRETMLLRLVEGLTGPQIAARTGLTHGSVRVNLHRGMALLRERLGLPDQREKHA